MLGLIKFYEKDFINTQGNLKNAYLKACKWVSKKIISKNIDKVVWNVEKVSETTITIYLYFMMEINEELKSYCKVCKEFHKSFFINEEYNCNSCKLISFFNKMKTKENVSKGYYKEIIKRE